MKFDFWYELSWYIPVRFSTTYTLMQPGGVATKERATWWQWRGRVFGDKYMQAK